MDEPYRHYLGERNHRAKQLLDGEPASWYLLTEVGPVVTCGVVSVGWGGAGGSLGVEKCLMYLGLGADDMCTPTNVHPAVLLRSVPFNYA